MVGVPQRVVGVLVEAAGDEWVAYVQSSNTAHALNPSAGALFNAIDGVRSAEVLASLLDVDVDVVALGLSELVEAGLVVVDGEVGRSSRRDLLRKIGIGSAAAAALPIVETIVAPTRAAASSLPPRTYPPTPYPTPSPTPGPTPAPGVVCTGVTATHIGWVGDSPSFNIVISGSGVGVNSYSFVLDALASGNFAGFESADFTFISAAISAVLQNGAVGTAQTTTSLELLDSDLNVVASCPNVEFKITIPRPPVPVVCNSVSTTHVGWTDQPGLFRPIFDFTVSGSGAGVTCTNIYLAGALVGQVEFPGFGVTGTVGNFTPDVLQNASVGDSLQMTVNLDAGSETLASCPNVTFTIAIQRPNTAPDTT